MVDRPSDFGWVGKEVRRRWGRQGGYRAATARRRDPGAWIAVRAVRVRRRLRLRVHCPRIPWADVLGRGGGVAISRVARAGKPAGLTTVVSACSRSRTVTLLESPPDEILGPARFVRRAWPGARSAALAEVVTSGHNGDATAFLALHDLRTGRELGVAEIGSTPGYAEDPPTYAVLRTVFTAKGDAVYAAEVGGPGRIWLLRRTGEQRVLEEGLDVDPGSVVRYARSL